MMGARAVNASASSSVSMKAATSSRGIMAVAGWRSTMRTLPVAGPPPVKPGKLHIPYRMTGRWKYGAGMVRLELKEGTSDRFWELALDGAGYKVRWGRIGTTGQEKGFSCPSPGAAK